MVTWRFVSSVVIYSILACIIHLLDWKWPSSRGRASINWFVSVRQWFHSQPVWWLVGEILYRAHYRRSPRAAYRPLPEYFLRLEFVNNCHSVAYGNSWQVVLFVCFSIKANRGIFGLHPEERTTTPPDYFLDLEVFRRSSISETVETINKRR